MSRDSESNQTLLGEAITVLLRESAEHLGEDLVRFFFRTQVCPLAPFDRSQLIDVSRRLLESVRSWIRSPNSRRANSAPRRTINRGRLRCTKPTLSFSSVYTLLPRALANLDASQLVHKAVARHRADTSNLYGLDPHLLPTELWTSRPTILEGLQWHFEASTALLRERIRDLGSALEEDAPNYGVGSTGTEMGKQQALQKEYKTQMADLAGFVFRTFEERILMLRTVIGDGPTTSEYRALHERYISVRSQIIHVLGQSPHRHIRIVAHFVSTVDLDKILQAYELAERHQDFRSLVELSTDPKHGSASRIRSFMEKYSEDFAFALYNYFLEKGQYSPTSQLIRSAD